MPLPQHVDQVATILHTLTTAEVIDNTFGLLTNLHHQLQSIQNQLPQAADALDKKTADRLRELVTTIEERPSLLSGIPEKWLINNVLGCAKAIRRRLGAE
jgi:hypothetical protein